MPTPKPTPPPKPLRAKKSNAPRGLTITPPQELSNRLDQAIKTTGHSATVILRRALTTYLNRLDAARADTNPPWHILTMAIEPHPIDRVDVLCGDLRCPPECAELPAWAYCWAQHDSRTHWWPTEPGEYRFRPVDYVSGGGEDGPNIVQTLDIQHRAKGGNWEDYIDPPAAPPPAPPQHRVTVIPHGPWEEPEITIGHIQDCDRLPYGQQCEVEKRILEADTGDYGYRRLQRPGAYEVRLPYFGLHGLEVKPLPAGAPIGDQAFADARPGAEEAGA
jgi:hypothetical protein